MGIPGHEARGAVLVPILGALESRECLAGLPNHRLRAAMYLCRAVRHECLVEAYVRVMLAYNHVEGHWRTIGTLQGALCT